MKERPIIFSGEMVRAVLDGRKTQTRRVVKFRHHTAKLLGQQFEHGLPCPYGEPGDRLWVRETWYPMQDVELSAIDNSPIEVVYKADWDRDGTTIEEAHDIGVYWKPLIFMPRWASRITLEIMNVSVERLQEISDVDALAEGIQIKPEGIPITTPKKWYGIYWNRLNAKRGWPWESNPFVWVIEFKMLEPAEDDPSLSLGTSASNPIG